MSKKIQKEYNEQECPFSWDKLDGLLAFKSGLVICSEVLGVHENTIKNHIKKRYSQTFTEYAERKMSRTKVKLVQRAIESAMSGNNVMLIFCLKNLCKWSDSGEDDSVVSGKVEIIVPNSKLKDV